MHPHPRLATHRKLPPHLSRPLLKHILVALQLALRPVRAEVCGIEPICLNPFEQCRKGGTRGGGLCILRHTSFQQVGNGRGLLWSLKHTWIPRIALRGRGQERHNERGDRSCVTGMTAIELRVAHITAAGFASDGRQSRERKRDHNHGDGEHGAIATPSLGRERLAFAVP